MSATAPPRPPDRRTSPERPAAGALSDHVAGFSKNARRFNAIAVVVPFVMFAVAVATLWGGAVDGTDLAIFGVGYVLTTLGITMGFHRLLTHRAFETKRWIRNGLAVLGCCAVEGPPITWIADHRKHHTFADEEGDPHSPHTHGGPGLRGTLRGLYHAHFGWLLIRDNHSDPLRYAADLVKDRDMRRISQLFPWIVLGSLAVPALAGFLLTGLTLHGAATGLLWGGFVRIFFVHHGTWAVNSLGHYYGRRRFETRDQSSNIAVMSIVSLGDSWHHNHHAFPRSAYHGLKKSEIDLTGYLITLMERTGLAWNVQRVSPEKQQMKEMATA